MSCLTSHSILLSFPHVSVKEGPQSHRCCVKHIQHIVLKVHYGIQTRPAVQLSRLQRWLYIFFNLFFYEERQNNCRTRCNNGYIKDRGGTSKSDKEKFTMDVLRIEQKQPWDANSSKRLHRCLDLPRSGICLFSASLFPYLFQTVIYSSLAYPFCISRVRLFRSRRKKKEQFSG